mgnify:CR=1 FL=1
MLYDIKRPSLQTLSHLCPQYYCPKPWIQGQIGVRLQCKDPGFIFTHDQPQNTGFCFDACHGRLIATRMDYVATNGASEQSEASRVGHNEQVLPLRADPVGSRYRSTFPPAHLAVMNNLRISTYSQVTCAHTPPSISTFITLYTSHPLYHAAETVNRASISRNIPFLPWREAPASHHPIYTVRFDGQDPAIMSTSGNSRLPSSPLLS